MIDRIKIIEKTITDISDVSIETPFLFKGSLLIGSISVKIPEDDIQLFFDVEIYPHYPLRSQDTETIKFVNKSLVEYSHVMEDGRICIHTSHATNLSQKLQIDCNSLKNWIIKYYLNKDNDTHYEHIIVPATKFNNAHHAYLFTAVDYTFTKGEYGELDYSIINSGLYNNDKINNQIIQCFKSNDKKIPCKWNQTFKNLKKSIGLYIFIETAPVKNKRFIVKNWNELEQYLSQDFLYFLYRFQKKHRNRKHCLVPIMIGYKTIENEVHWQTLLVRIGHFPIYTIKQSRKYIVQLKDVEINWVLSHNCSYKYFFGRGTLNKSITTSRILIIGVGAIGSIVAKTLVKGGCTNIDFVDYDIKEPENVCRAEYSFHNGITNKTEELINELTLMSPFLETTRVNQTFFDHNTKALYENINWNDGLRDVLNNYDLIFDCTTDNDLMYILSQVKFKSKLINLSITNHAKELVCAFSPNTYHFVINQFSKVLENDIEDLYNPTGCWSPTFKASYNDINVLVQYAIKHINILITQNKSLNNFVLETDTLDGFNIKLKEF